MTDFDKIFKLVGGEIMKLVIEKLIELNNNSYQAIMLKQKQS